MSDRTAASYASAELVNSYKAWTADAVAQLRHLVDSWRQERCPGDDARQRILEIAHNIKGMGSSFGHPLMTEAGRSLCAYLRLKAGAPDELPVVEAHVESLDRILALGPVPHDNITHAQFIAPLHRLTGLSEIEA
ncbi:Hpt domain-containing protein [Pedomonas sp. V897]|mgnify:FL=1|uniref:Hpt domain-containing protein n=1 Tax=Pedomonas sp. V897 TaxID=3446482 RepID=UPI003EE342AB